jgi:alpha-1,2-mannosyltransferase
MLRQRFVDFLQPFNYALLVTPATMAFLSNAVLVLFILTVTVVLLPQLVGSLVGLLFRGVGWLIRRRTRSRREYVIARARSEEEETQMPRAKNSAHSLAKSQDDEDWEKVDSTSGVKTTTSSDSGASTGGEDAEWDGIIGFFHPFW